jgi:hypothetical protein
MHKGSSLRKLFGIMEGTEIGVARGPHTLSRNVNVAVYAGCKNISSSVAALSLRL